MSFVNAVLRHVLDLLLAPFAGLPPIVSLVVVSLPTAILMLVVFKHTSDQAALAAVKRNIHAGLFLGFAHRCPPCCPKIVIG